MNQTDKIIQALDQTQKVKPTEKLISKMENFALAYANKVNSFSKTSLIGMAASFLILMAVNIYAVDSYNSGNSSTEIETESEGYNLIPTKSIYG